jgi:maleylacetoacetate isomerase
LPGGPADRARIRALALQVAANLHPLNNVGILNYLRDGLGVGKDGVLAWYRHWITERLSGLEGMARRHADRGGFLYGDAPTLADICLVPQLYNARRFDCPLEDYPRLTEVDERARALPAFAEAAPEKQPDAPKA